jgi:hypothetical protein
MKRKWMYVQNVFANVTNGNYLLMLKISTYHINALKAKAGDAYFDGLIAFYEPLHDAFVAEYNKWAASIGTHVGGTKTFDDFLRELSEDKIEEWDIAIQVVYRRSTGPYLALLPKYRKPFQSGSNEGRVSAVAALSVAIGASVPLAAVKTSVDAFLLLLNEARADQQGEMSDSSDYSEDVEVVRFAAAQGQYSDLGSLMTHFYLTPVAIEPYFDLENIRKVPQTLFTGTVKKESVINLFKRTMKPDTEILMANTATVPLKFAFVAEKNDDVAVLFIIVAPGEEETVPASALGNVPDNKYFKIKNEDTSTDGTFTVEIL